MSKDRLTLDSIGSEKIDLRAGSADAMEGVGVGEQLS